MATAGPKKAALDEPLDWKPRAKGADRLRLFSERYLRVPKGNGAKKPLKLREWQLDMATGLYDDDVTLLTWVLPRGNGKSSFSAALALEHVFTSGIDSPRVILVAQGKNEAQRVLDTVIRMVELNDDLADRCKVFKDRIEVPFNNGSIVALVGEAHLIEGEDATLVIIDEIGFVRRDAFESAVLSTGKRGGGKVLCIGTPSPAKWQEISPLWDLVQRGREDPNDPSFVLVEFGADPKDDIDDPEVWAKANPAYGDWLTEKNIRSERKNVRELEFKRARLGVWSQQSSEPAFLADKWHGCERAGVKIPEGSPVVLAFDGSHNNDSTAILIGSISSKPHYQVGALWEPKDGEVVNHLEVEDKIRELAKRYRVTEIIADPYRWQRSLQVLEEEGLPVYGYPQTPQRQTPATNDLRAAVNGMLLTHDGDKRLTQHVLRSAVQETTRGVKLVKPSGVQKIDLAVCLMMAHSRCTWLASPKQRRKKLVRGYKN